MPVLPPVIEAYFMAQKQDSPTALAACFTADAVVHDEGKDHGGIDAIKDWHAEVMAKTPFTARPLSVEERGGHVLVATEISGAFRGSPLTLEHDFTLAGSRIARLEIR